MNDRDRADLAAGPNSAAVAAPDYGLEAPVDALAPSQPSSILIDGTAECLAMTLDGAQLLHSSGLVRIGVRCHGELNTNAPGDPVFPILGLRYVPTGSRSTEPGCQCEGWGAGVGTPAAPMAMPTCTGESGGADRSVGGIDNLTLLSFNYDGEMAESVVQLGSTFEIEHHYSPSTCSPNLFQVDVSITNITGSDVNVLYRRSIDWDIDPTPFNEFVTIDDGTGTAVWRTCTNGFLPPDPCEPFNCLPPHELGPPTGPDPLVDTGPFDFGALFDFNFGILPAGMTLTFETYYGATATEAEADIARAACSLEAYSYGQPNCPDGDSDCMDLNGPDDGQPNTFIFGFANIEAPVICGNAIVEEDEECDDGRQCDDLVTDCDSVADCPAGSACLPRDGDGCSAACLIEENVAPEVTCLDPVVPNDPGLCSADVACSDIATCDDPDGDPTVQTCDPPGPYPVGMTDVSVTCQDPSMAEDTEICTVVVVDEEPPTCTAPPPIVLECLGPDGVPGDDPAILGWLDMATASDNCGVVSFTHDAPENFPSGCEPGVETTVTWTAVDAAGNMGTCSSTVTVVDTTPPVVEGSDDILACLWPPNHWYVCFTPDDLPMPMVSEACGTAEVTISGCASNQPDDAPDPDFPGYNGDGHTFNDCVVLPDGEGFCVRAERCGTGPDAKDGRFYSVTVVATDECGNVSPDETVGTIWVPHDMRGKPKPNCLKTTQVGCRPNQDIPCK